MLLKENMYYPPQFEIDHIGSFRRRHHFWKVDDEAIEKSVCITLASLEAFKSKQEANRFKKFSSSWEGYCFQRKILEEVHDEGHDMAETIFLGGNRSALQYLELSFLEGY